LSQSKAEFKTRKEAAWAITNASSGGTAEQIKFLVQQGCIPPLCDLLTVMDSKIVQVQATENRMGRNTPRAQVALNGLENILRLGEQEVKTTGAANPYAVIIEEVFGLDKIEFLQSHENMEIYQKAFDIIERYFGTEEEDKEVSGASEGGQGHPTIPFQIAPATDANTNQFSFAQSAEQEQQQPGFNF
jgi:hypothetical protein